MCLNFKKEVQDRSKQFQGSKNNIIKKKDFLEKPPFTKIIT